MLGTSVRGVLKVKVTGLYKHEENLSALNISIRFSILATVMMLYTIVVYDWVYQSDLLQDQVHSNLFLKKKICQNYVDTKTVMGHYIDHLRTLVKVTLLKTFKELVFTLKGNKYIEDV